MLGAVSAFDFMTGIMKITGKISKSTWGICARRAGKLFKARYQLYQGQILQEDMRWKALAEIYTMHSFAPF